MRRSVIFFSAGLGNALLAQPLIKRLKARGDQVTGIFTTDWGAYEAYAHTGLLDHQVRLLGKRSLANYGMTHLKRFGTVFLDFFAATRPHLLLASMIGKQVITNRSLDRVPRFVQPAIRFQPPGVHLHEGAQYLRMLDRTVQDTDLTLNDFHFTQFPTLPPVPTPLTDIKGPYIPVQPVGGNNRAPYKSWPLKTWQAFFDLAHRAWPHLTFVALGDANETEQGTALAKASNVISLVGQTSLPQAMAVLQKGAFYLGIDSGLMHLAVALGQPTITLWGGSDHRLFGYEKVDPTNNVILKQSPECWPCNAYISPNTSRVTDPLSCPDFKCIRQINPDQLMEAMQPFVNRFASA